MSEPPKPDGVEKMLKLDDNSKRLLAEQLGIDPDKLAVKEMQMSPEFVDKLRRGEVKFVPRPATMEQVMAMQPAAMSMPRGVDGIVTRKYSPRAQLEARYRQERELAKLPNSTAGLAVNAATAATRMTTDEKTLTSRYTEYSQRLKRKVLAYRPIGAPSIIDECQQPIKLVLSQHQSPGDLLMLSRAVEDLHISYPGVFITQFRTAAHELWQNNPRNQFIANNDPAAMWIACEYKLINTASLGAHHFCHAFRKELEARLGIPIDQTSPRGVIRLSPQEKAWASQVHEITGKDLPFWILDAGCKSDCTNKQWEVARYQELVDRTPEITWVQIGSAGSNKNPNIHPELHGPNLINLVNKTTIRQLVRLMYHAAGVVTPVSFPMHMSAAVDVHPRYKRLNRPCIVIAGGREPSMWEAYSTHQFLHTCGALPCCGRGGCWKARNMPLGDGDDKDYDEEIVNPDGTKYLRIRLCEYPIVSKSGQVVPKCMDMITVDMVLERISWYLSQYDYQAEDSKFWTEKWPVPKPAVVCDAIRAVNRKTVKGEIRRKSGSKSIGVVPMEDSAGEEEMPNA